MDLPVYAPEDVNHPLWVDRIRDLQPDVIFSFYYRHMLSDEISRWHRRAASTCTVRCCRITVAAR